jgi:hypothetical protein
MSTELFIGTTVFAIVFGFLLFLLLRALMLWYWKINLIVQKLEGILVELKKISSSRIDNSP